jgi:hypothetical protein
MKAKHLCLIAICILLFSACSSPLSFIGKSNYAYVNGTSNGTSVQLQAYRFNKYSLTIDDSINVTVGQKQGFFYADPSQVNLKPTSKNRITIFDVPPGDHSFVVQTDYKFPLKHYVNDTIRFTTTTEQKELVVHTKKPPYSTGAKIIGVTVGAIDIAIISLFLSIVLYWPQH